MNLDMLNRLRVNAGKPELKSWKASAAKLTDAIKGLQAAGFKPDEEEPVVHKQKAQLARGLETEGMARQSRIAVQMERERERKEEKEARASDKAVKRAAEKLEKSSAKLAKGQVDPKKDPDKAKRQTKIIEDKKAARAATKPKDKDANEISVADIARELGIDPKVARAKLRRHEDKLDKLHTKGQDRWVFPIGAKAQIVGILK